MNVKALGDYGSLEFRAMRGTRDMDLIYSWAETLLNLREFAKQFDNPAEIADTFSMRGPSNFMGDALGGNYKLFRSEEHTSELQSLMRISYAVFCLQKKKRQYTEPTHASH